MISEAVAGRRLGAVLPRTRRALLGHSPLLRYVHPETDSPHRWGWCFYEATGEAVRIVPKLEEYVRDPSLAELLYLPVRS